MKEKFSIGDYNFSIDRNESTIEINGNQIIDLTIKADENVFDQLYDKENFEFSYGLYSPEFYAHQIDLGKSKQIVINEQNQNNYEVALYFMEHNDVDVNISILNNWIIILGKTYINGKKYPIEIKLCL